MTRLFLGIDGGGTRTRAFLTDAAGRCASWGESGLSNPNHASAEEVRANLERAILGAFHQLELSRSGCVSVFLGMAGVTTEPGRKEMRRLLANCGLGHATIAVDHDIRIALAGGLAGQPGIALIVGTGSSCYGRTTDGKSWQTGGWEALISDEGSGYYLGREAISAAARMADGRQPESPLKARVFDWLGITAIADVLPRIHDQGLSRTEIAAFAPQVTELAQNGDVPAQDILDRGAQLLAEMVIANHRQLPTGPRPDVVITGGLGTANTMYRLKIEQAILHDQPTARIWSPQLSPAVGGALLALEQAGVPATPELLDSLRALSP